MDPCAPRAPLARAPAAMITVTQLGKSYGARTLFEDVSLKLVTGARYGLVGANGSGKTTLMQILCGDLEASEGSVSIPKSARLGVLRQDQFLADAEPILAVAMAGDAIVTAALNEQRALLDADVPDAARLA
ncbi:MAG: ATP-binding cassette domain-containing protein, partial [Polyangiales bacterium]